MEMTDHIADLLSEHDCVIIPGVGGFVGSYMPAQVHPVYHTFQPPSKKILFNINLRQNDGLLANHIAQKEKIGFDQAGETIRIFAEETARSLRTRKYLILRGIGKLYMGKEGNIQFEQEMRSNLLVDSFGLQPFFSAPVKRDPRLEKLEKRQQLRTETREMVRRAIPKPLKWAAILAVPVAVAVLLAFAGYDSIKSGSWSTADILSSLSPFSKTVTKPVPPATPRQVNPEPVRAPVRSAPPEQSPPEIREPALPSVSFAVIIGAFGVESNADKLVGKLNRKGIKAGVFDRSAGGLIRVAAGVFESREAALKMMNDMKADGFPGAWILEK